MELIWGEDFDALAKITRTAFAKDSPLESRDAKFDMAAHHRQIVSLGWLEAGDPVSRSQGSTGLASLAGIYVELGRALIDSPVLGLSTARDAALLVGNEAGKRLADQIGEGSARVIPVPADTEWAGQGVRHDSGALAGTVLGVTHAEYADAFLVEATTADTRSMVLVDAALVVRQPMPNIGGRSLHSLCFDGIEISGENVVAEDERAGDAFSRAGLRADLMLAAQVYGAGARLLDMTVEYAKQRHQFGGPIGRFQAVQYLCTDMAIAAHLTSAFIRSAAGALDSGEDATIEVAYARRQAARAAQELVHAAHEVHAGIGFMVESDVHLFTKAAKYWQFALHRSGDETIIANLSTEPEDIRA